MLAEQVVAPAARTRFRVRRKWLVAIDVVGLELEPLNSSAVPSFVAGAHVEVRLARPGEPGVIRHFSLCNSPEERDAYVFGIKREPNSRGGSTLVHDHLQEGDLVETGEPRNNFRLEPGATRHLLLAGGIGVTPLLAMAQHASASGWPFELHYFARSHGHVAFRDRLEAMNSQAQVKLLLGLTPAETERAVASALAGVDAGTHVYACGPAAFMELVERLGSPAVGTERLHFEHFNAAPVAALQTDQAFVVELTRSGVTCEVGAEESIVQALERAGHCPEVSCEQGVCGTCLTRVLAGTPEHRDSYLNAAEKAKGDQMLICVSRALTDRLVLDR